MLQNFPDCAMTLGMPVGRALLPDRVVLVCHALSWYFLIVVSGLQQMLCKYTFCLTMCSCCNSITPITMLEWAGRDASLHAANSGTLNTCYSAAVRT